jgi:DNA-binding transcriptional MerR regulator
MSGMSIGEVAARTGIPASTLRYYEDVGLLPPPDRINGQRRYDESIVRLLAVIQVAKQANFSLGEIRELLGASSASDGWQVLAERKIAEADAMIARANQIKQIIRVGLDCTCTDLDDCELVAGF